MHTDEPTTWTFADGTLGAHVEDLDAILAEAAQAATTNGRPPAAFIRLGMHPDDLALWPAALNQSPPNSPDNPADPAVVWTVLSNRLSALAANTLDLPVHDALAWLIADAPTVCDLLEGPLLLAGWARVTAHGWLPHAAGLSPSDYEADPAAEQTLRAMAALRGHALPPIRT